MVFGFGRSRAPTPTPPLAPAPRSEARIPEGQRVYAIGDVHGRLDLLDPLLRIIAADDQAREPRDVTIVFLGDLVDRGPDSKGVIDRVLALRAHDINARILCGNHEEIFLLSLNGDAKALRFFLRIGGRETLASYGITATDIASHDDDALIALVQERVPVAHREFLEGLEDMITVGDYCFVHAGVRPGVALAEQSVEDLRWIRREFLTFEGTHGAVVVHGHTPADEIEWTTNRIGVDTGAYATGILSAIGLDGGDRWALAASSG
jgi:serine/threonine protein phosphatase 1